MEGKRNEEVWLLCLDGKRNLINCVKIVEGDICCANVSPRKVVNIALSNNAVAVVMAHNHPAGFAVPSDEDVLVTNHLAAALRHTGIRLLDHIVVTDTDYVSMFQSRLYIPDDM